MYSPSMVYRVCQQPYDELEIRSMERGICPIAVFYFALKRSFFNI